MDRVEKPTFVDLAKPVSPERAERLALGRRSFLGAAAALATATGMAPAAFARNFGAGSEPIRYPEPDVVVLDDRFAKYKIGNTPLMRLYTGMLWAEGPAWNGVGRYLVFSDIPNNEQLRYLEEDDQVTRRFRCPSNSPTATHSIGRAGRSRASTAPVGSCATSTTAASPCSLAPRTGRN